MQSIIDKARELWAAVKAAWGKLTSARDDDSGGGGGPGPVW